MTIKIIPTVLAFDKKTFNQLFKKIVPISDEIQIDFMDGRFVETKSIGEEDAPDVSKYKDKTFEAHLMVKEPLSWVPRLADKGYKRMIIHFETIWEEDIIQLQKFMQREKVKFILAINPETQVKKVVKYAKYIDGILFLGVHPGQNGAEYITKTPYRIKEWKLHAEVDVPIQVDGGMTPDSIPSVVRAGATRINSGSYVANADNPAKALEELYEACDER